MSIWELYFLTRLEPVNIFVLTGAIICGIVLLVCTIYYAMESSGGFGDESTLATLKNLRKRSFVIEVILSVLLVLLPTTKDMAIILGGYWVTNNKEVEKLPENVVKTVNSFLKKYHDDGKEEKE